MASAVAYEPVAAWLNRPYQTEDGLPDNSVTGIAQTSDGYLWVATRGGLLRYNGQKFSLLPPANLPPLPSRTVRAMFRDHRDHIWLGMERGPLICLMPDGLKVYLTNPPSALRRMTAITEDREGAVWVAFPGQLRWILNGRLESINVPGNWSGGGDLLLSRDAAGDIWCAKATHVGFWSNGNFITTTNFAAPVAALCASGQTGMWAAAGGRLYKFGKDQAVVDMGKLPTSSTPRVLLEDRPGSLWIGTSGGGLFHWNGQQFEPVPTSHQEINCLFQDREENLWVGTEGGGLNLLRQRTAALIDRQGGLPFESVRSVTEDAAGGVWAVSQDGQLACATDGRWSLISSQTNWPGVSVTCVAADETGGVWVGTSDAGLKHLQNGSWQSWRMKEGLSGDFIRSLLVSSNRDVWVGVGFPNRLHRLRDGRILTIKNSDSLGPIRALAEDAAGTIWVGTAEGQLRRVQGDALVAEPAIVEKASLSIRSLLATKDGGLWIGYAGDGLGCFHNGRYVRLTTASGLADDFISQLLADNHGNLWINANHGLSRVSISELARVCNGQAQSIRPQSYGRLDGLPAMQPSRDFCPSVFRARDGHLWFAMHNGLLVVQPDFILDNPFPPAVLVEGVRVDDHLVAADNAGSAMLPGGLTNCVNLRGLAGPLLLRPGHLKVEIDFAALSFASPEDVQLRYRLSRFDDDWVDAGPIRRATYPRLPAGDYEFQVIACNNSGVWNESGAMLTLRVAPFFYETWWFKIGGGVATALAAAGIAFAASRKRYREKLRRLEARRALEQERARIARDIHDDLGASLTRISLLSQPSRSDAGDVAIAVANLGQIHQTARDLTHAMGEVVWAVNPEHDTFDSLANYISHYAQNFLRAAGVRCRIEVPLNLPRWPLSAEIRHNLFLAFKEALNNVVKHAEAKEVRISLTPGKSGFELSVQDNGRGFARAEVAAQTVGADATRPVPGNGLANMQGRVHEIGGDCEIKSDPGTGTRVTFRVKLAITP